MYGLLNTWEIYIQILWTFCEMLVLLSAYVCRLARTNCKIVHEVNFYAKLSVNPSGNDTCYYYDTSIWITEFLRDLCTYNTGLLQVNNAWQCGRREQTTKLLTSILYLKWHKNLHSYKYKHAWYRFNNLWNWVIFTQVLNPLGTTLVIIMIQVYGWLNSWGSYLRKQVKDACQTRWF